MPLRLPDNISIDWSSGTCTNRSTGERLSVKEAVGRGLLDSDYVEKLAENAESIRKKIEINWEEGTINDRFTLEKMTIDEAENRKLIDKETAKILRAVSGKFEKEVSSERDKLVEVQKHFSGDRKEEISEERTTTKTFIEQNTKETRHQTRRKVSINDLTKLQSFSTESVLNSLRSDDIDLTESYIVNPENAEVITIQEAIREGIFNEQTGFIVNKNTGEKYTLEMAHQEGLIPPSGKSITRTIESGFVRDHFQDVANSEKQIHTSVQANLKTSLTESMLKPKSCTFAQAVEAGLIDENVGTFFNPYNNEIYSIASAIQEGWISENGSMKEISIEPLRKYEKKIVVHQVAPADDIKRLSFTQALEQGLIDLSHNQYTDLSSGKVLSIGDALQQQLIDCSIISKEENYPISLSGAIDAGAFDETEGIFTSPRTGEKMSLSDAINKGFIDRNSSMYDVDSGKVYTLEEAIVKGKIDPSTGQYIQNSFSKLSIKEAAKKGAIALIGAPYLAIKAIGDLKEKDTEKGMTDMHSLRKKGKPVKLEYIGGQEQVRVDEPVTIQATKFSVLDSNVLEVTQVRELTSVTAKDSVKMNFMEAVSSGYLNTDTGMFKEPDTGEYLTLQNAISKGKIHADSAKMQTKGGKYINLQEAMRQGIMDNTGHCIDRKGDTLSLKTLIENGDMQECIPNVHAASSLVVKTIDKILVNSVVDPRNNSLVSLCSALDTGLVNPHDGTYTNPKSGEILSIMDAVQFGYIQGQVVDSITVKEGLSKEGFKAEVTFSEKKKMKIATVLDTKTGQKLSLHEAIREGIIDENTNNYTDKQTGEVLPIPDAIKQQFVTGSEIEANMSSAEQYQKFDEQFLTQTHSIDVNKVIDPDTKNVLSIVDAVEQGVLDIPTGVIRNLKTGEEMSLTEAIKSGIVQGAPTSRKSGIFEDTLPKMYVLKPNAAQLKTVYDHDEARFIQMKQAIQKGIIDEINGFYLQEDGSSMSIAEAVQQGLIQTEQQPRLAEESQTYTIHSLLDLNSGKRVTASEGIEKGLLNLQQGIYLNPITKEKLTIPQAVDGGFIDADVSRGEFSVPFLKPISPLQEGSQKPYSVTIVLDPFTREELSVTEAVSRGVLDQSICKYLDTRTGQTLTLKDAVDKGLVLLDQNYEIPVQTHVKKEVISVSTIIDPVTGKEYRLTRAVEKGLFDPEKSMVRNNLTGKWMSLDDAVKQGLARIEQAAGVTEQEIIRGIVVKKVKDPMTGQDLSVKEAKKRGILNSDSGDYVDKKTNMKIPIEDALKNDLITGHKSSSSRATNIKKCDTKHVTLSQALDTRTGTELSVEEAVQRGLVDKDLLQYIEPRTGKIFPVEDAMKEGFVSGSVSVQEATKTEYSEPRTKTYNITSVLDTKSGKHLSVAGALKAGVLGPTGQFIDTKNNQVMPVSDAIKAGLVETELREKGTKKKNIKLIEPGNELQVVTFTQALKSKFINGVDGTFSDPFGQNIVPVDAAILTGRLVNDFGKPFKFKPVKKDKITYSFQQAFKSGLLDMKTGLFWYVKKGKSYTVDEAVKKGYLNSLCDNSQPLDQQDGSVVIVKSEVVKPVSITQYSVGECIDAKGDHKSLSGKTSSDILTYETEVDGHIEEKSILGKKVADDHLPLTLTDAITSGLVNMKTGDYIDSISGESMSVDEAVICGFLDLDKPQRLYNVELSRNTKTPISISTAIESSLIDGTKGTFCDPGSQTCVTIQQAIQLGYIQPKMSDDNIHEGIKDKETNGFTDMSKHLVMVQEGSPFDPKTDKVYRDGELISRTMTEIVTTQGSATYVTHPGFSIDSVGTVLNKFTGERMSIGEAMKNGILDIEAVEGTEKVKTIGSSVVPPTLDDTDSESLVRLSTCIHLSEGHCICNIASWSHMYVEKVVFFSLD